VNHYRLLDRRPLVWLVAVAIAGLSVTAQLASFGTPDIGFLLYAAARVLGGARLYRDVVEINPPLIILLNLPIVAAARALSLSEFAVYRVCVAALLAGDLLLCRAILRHHVAPTQMLRRGLLLALVVVLFPLSGESFGEREHLVLAGLLPYLLVVAARHEAHPVSLRIGVGAGIAAGLSIALKPHFVVVWIAAEVYDWARRGRRPALPTPETWATLGSLAAYAAAVWLVTPEYLRVAADLGPAYHTYLQVPWVRLALLHPGAPLVWFALLSAVVARRYDRGSRAVTLLGIAVAACFGAGLAQQKGLPYHFYPAVGLAAFLLTFIVLAPARPRTPIERIYRVAAGLVLAGVLAVVAARTVVSCFGGTPGERRRRHETLALAKEIRERANGGAVAILSYHIASAFPLINYARVPLASRFPHLWLVPATYWNELSAEAPIRYRASDAMEPPERFLRRSVRDDLLRWQPRLLLVLRAAPDEPRYFLRRIDYLDYLSQQPELAQFLKSYAFVGDRGEYDLYQRQVGSAAPVSPGADRLRMPDTATMANAAANRPSRTREASSSSARPRPDCGAKGASRFPGSDVGDGPRRVAFAARRS
jgi:hypothetical protein